MRAGVAQQIGTPEELYNRPANLFVAGVHRLAGDELLPGDTWTAASRSCRSGRSTLTQQMQDVIAMHTTPRNVIVGVRPEHFEDAALIDGYQRIRSLTFPVRVELVESLGADKYVYFSFPGAERSPSISPS